MRALDFGIARLDRQTPVPPGELLARSRPYSHDQSVGPRGVTVSATDQSAIVDSPEVGIPRARIIVNYGLTWRLEEGRTKCRAIKNRCHHQAVIIDSS